MIGLSRTDCECYTGSMPDDATISASGLFIDEAPGLNLKKIFAGASCEADGWTLLARAKEEGQNRAKNEVLRGVKTLTRWKRPPVRSQIGSSDNSRGSVKLTNAYHGMSVILAHHVGGTATINRIGAAFRFTGNVVVDVYRVGESVPIATRTIAAVNGSPTWTPLTSPIVLPMESDTEQNPTYDFVFTPQAGQQAINVRINTQGCSCKLPPYNTGYFESAVKLNGLAWTQWAMARGIKGNDLNNLQSFATVNETQGLMLDVSFACDPWSALCSGEPDYATDMVQNSFAHAARYAAAVWLIDMLSVGSGVDRDALVGGEAVGKLRTQYEGRFGKIVADFLIPTLSEEPMDGDPNSGVNTYSDCFTCDTSNEPRIAPIQI